MKRVSLIVFFVAFSLSLSRAQVSDPLERSQVTFDSISVILQKDTSFFTELNKLLPQNDSLTEKFRKIINTPFDSIATRFAYTYNMYSSETGDVVVKENADPAHVIETLLMYYDVVKKERKYKETIETYYKKRGNKPPGKKHLVGKYQSVGLNNDTTTIEIRSDSTFSYKWIPIFSHHGQEYLESTGTWKFKNHKIILNTKYQSNQSRFFEFYKPEYGDTVTRIYLQTYDSLPHIFKFLYLGIKSDSIIDSQMLLPDPEFPDKRCLVTFRVPHIDKIFFQEGINLSPFEPKDKRSNCFVLQFNIASDYDYQYFTDQEFDFIGTEISSPTGYGERITLKKKKK